MNKILTICLFLILIFSCKKDKKTTNNATDSQNIENPQTYSFYNTFFVWDSVRLNSATLNNYRFKITVFRNNQIFKIIRSTNNKIYFENFALGKYDIMIEDSLNNFSTFRDTVILDNKNLNLYYQYEQGTWCVVDIIKYPNLTFNQIIKSEDTSRVFFNFTFKPVRTTQGYCVYFNNINQVNTNPDHMFRDFRSNQIACGLSSPDPSYYIQGLISPSVGNNTDTSGWFSVYKSTFKMNFNYHSGDSIYFFVFPAVYQYYMTSFVRDYSVSKQKYWCDSKLFTAINKNKHLTIGYKFN